MKTVSFSVDRVQQDVKGVTIVSGHHAYTDRKGASHTVLVRYVLKKLDDDFYLTQVGAAPEKR